MMGLVIICDLILAGDFGLKSTYGKMVRICFSRTGGMSIGRVPTSETIFQVAVWIQSLFDYSQLPAGPPALCQTVGGTSAMQVKP